VVGVLDVDGAGEGWLAQDAGSLVAHLEAVGEVWPAVDPRVRAYAEEVAGAYRAAARPP
jgi:Ser/Thr protein kinase RdoA (MazF antagonist)